MLWVGARARPPKAVPARQVRADPVEIRADGQANGRGLVEPASGAEGRTSARLGTAGAACKGSLTISANGRAASVPTAALRDLDMLTAETCLIILPAVLSALALALDGYMKRFPTRCDDLWKRPRPVRLR